MDVILLPLKDIQQSLERGLKIINSFSKVHPVDLADNGVHIRKAGMQTLFLVVLPVRVCTVRVARLPGIAINAFHMEQGNDSLS